MNCFEAILERIKKLEATLAGINQCRSYRITRIFRVIWTEVKSLRPRRIGRLSKRIMQRLGGKKDAMKEYISQDSLVNALEQTNSLQLYVSTKIKQLQEVDQLVDNSQNLRSTLENTPDINMDEFCWLNFNHKKQSEKLHKTGGKRVAYFTNLLLDWEDKRPRFGGGERYCLTLSRLLQKNGFEVHVYQTAPTEFSGEYYGLPVQTIPCGNYYSEFNIDAAEKFYEISLDYDYVIYNLPELAAMRMRPDAMLICHGIWFDHSNYSGNIKFRENKWFEHLYRAFDNPQGIVSVDTNSINVIRVLWPNLVNKMTFIPNFVDHKTFYPPKESRKNAKLKILFPRRSQINRGSRLVEGILQGVPHDVDFYWVGEGDSTDTEMLKKLAKKDKRLHYNAATFDEMPEWYRKADIAVIPTIACEGTSLSCIEAMASGCATISTNVGGLTDLVYDEFNGLLVNPTVEEIAEAINRLIEDAELRERLQDKGFTYSHNFSVENWEKRWLKVLDKQGWLKKKNDYCIVTKNAIHGGVESLIKLEAAKLGADIIVAGGLNDPDKTCPFQYDYIDNYLELKERLSSYQCILYHWPFEWAVRAIKDSGVPCVEFVHRTDTAECDKNVPNVIVSHSQYVCDYISKTYKRECCLVPNVVNTDFYKPYEGAKEKIIGAVTSYYDTKGIDILIHAWKQVQDKLSEYRFIIYGAGDQRTTYESLANKLGCRIEINGPVPNSKQAYDQMMMVVSASRIEGLPIALLEAISCGLPILASDIDGHLIINKLVQAKGLPAPVATFKTENPDDLAKQLLELVPHIGQNFLSKGALHKIAVDVFSPEQHVNGLLQAFKIAKEEFNSRTVLFSSSRCDEAIKGNLYNINTSKTVALEQQQCITNSNYAVYDILLREGFNFLTVDFSTQVGELTNITIQADATNRANQSKAVHAEGFLLGKQASNVLICYDYDCQQVTELHVSLRCNLGESFLLNNASVTYYKVN
ncbi:MAG: glycosyltransferase [Angelakisella sp.]|nr:glycosyltransferase [Angelakisella sp.]